MDPVLYDCQPIDLSSYCVCMLERMRRYVRVQIIYYGKAGKRWMEEGKEAKRTSCFDNSNLYIEF